MKTEAEHLKDVINPESRDLFVHHGAFSPAAADGIKAAFEEKGVVVLAKTGIGPWKLMSEVDIASDFVFLYPFETFQAHQAALGLINKGPSIWNIVQHALAAALDPVHGVVEGGVNLSDVTSMTALFKRHFKGK